MAHDRGSGFVGSDDPFDPRPMPSADKRKGRHRGKPKYLLYVPALITGAVVITVAVILAAVALITP